MLLGGVLAFLSLGLLPSRVWAAGEDKLANKTIDRTVSLRTHSIYAPYIDQDLQNRWWDFGADAYVNTNKHIRLTRARPSQMGWLWSRLPITSSNFIMEVEFKFSGDSSHLFGDGMAVWFTTARAQPGPVFGSIDNFNGFGIFLDTYANSRHSYAFPRIVGIKGDGKTSYNVGTDGEPNVAGACSANYRRTNVATKLKVTYIKEAYLDVKIQYKAWDEWSDCFTIQGADVLPPAPFLGFSAMTGDVFDNHDIISVTTHSAVLSNPSYQRDKIGAILEAEGSSFVVKAAKFFILVGALLSLFYGARAYYRRQNRGMGMGIGGMGPMSRTPGFQTTFYQDAKRF
ncbi:legume-like lectin [Cristinia sonorae]|uniref:Legume-like lectin n=1 Tax=Cristinia sonorae TaxID=1940300 RepID=A0A8K0USD9_9AGAR|nr:legume-like lectin [Cristinia sonorae]